MEDKSDASEWKICKSCQEHNKVVKEGQKCFYLRQSFNCPIQVMFKKKY